VLKMLRGKGVVYSSIALVPYDTSTLEMSTADYSGASSNLFSLSSS